MNNNPNENEKNEQQVTNAVETLNENKPEVLDVQEAPATAEAIVSQMEAQAAKANQVYESKTAPVAPQQDRIQLIDTKPKLHAVQFGGVTMATEKKEEKTEVSLTVENTSEVTAENVTPSNGGNKKSAIGLFLLFGGLLLLIIFLPDISSYISTQKYLREQQVEEKITTGTLECTLEDSSETLDYDYTFSFGFADSKLTRLKSVTEIRGDVSLDEVELDKLKAQCDLLQTIVTDLSGISVSCKLENGLFTKSQTFNFSSIVVDDAITAYIEAGGSYPFYRNGDNIDEVERELISTNYNCKRTK